MGGPTGDRPCASDSRFPHSPSLPLLSVAAPPADKTKPVDVVLCLDTSGSMDGLIDSAKRKLWDVVNDLAKMEPTPSLRVALYSYGNNTYDAGQRLGPQGSRPDDRPRRGLQAAQRPPGPPPAATSTSPASPADALAELKWADDKEPCSSIFVCGNEPVDQDKEVTLESVAATAKAKGVVVNTIYCGPADQPEAAGWARVRHRSAAASTRTSTRTGPRRKSSIKTPFDDEIQKLGTKINETYLGTALKGGRQGQPARPGRGPRPRRPAGWPPSGPRPRPARLYKNAECDLIDKMLADKDFDLKKMKEEDLPAGIEES